MQLNLLKTKLVEPFFVFKSKTPTDVNLLKKKEKNIGYFMSIPTQFSASFIFIN